MDQIGFKEDCVRTDGAGRIPSSEYSVIYGNGGSSMKLMGEKFSNLPGVLFSCFCMICA